MGSATPMSGSIGGATPGATPSVTGGATPMGGMTPGATPMGGMDMQTPTPGQLHLRTPMTPDQYNLLKWEREMDERNKPLSDEELDAMFPMVRL